MATKIAMDRDVFEMILTMQRFEKELFWLLFELAKKNEEGAIYESQAKLAEILGASVRTVSYTMKSLTNKGLVGGGGYKRIFFNLARFGIRETSDDVDAVCSARFRTMTNGSKVVHDKLAARAKRVFNRGKSAFTNREHSMAESMVNLKETGTFPRQDPIIEMSATGSDDDEF